MTSRASITGLALAAALLCGSVASASEIRLIDLETGRETALSGLLPELRRNRILLVGDRKSVV